MPKVKTGNPLYRNIQYITGGVDETTSQEAIQFGDGEKRAFIVSYELMHVPTVEVDRGSGYVAETVGIRGVELKQWLWQKNDNTITQDDNEPVLGPTDSVKITYIGGYDIIGISEGPGAVARQKAIEGGGTSGKVEALSHETAITGYQAVLELAGFRISKYSPDSTTLQFRTMRTGLVAGQLLTVDGFEYLGVDGLELLVTKVDAKDTKGVFYYDVDACVGPAQESWASFFKKLQRSTVPNIRLGIADTRSLLLPTTFSRVWIESERPNIFYFDFPSATRFPAAGYWPNFTPGGQVQYATVHDGATEIDRRSPTTVEGMTPASEQIITTTYYSPTDVVGDITAFGWAGGAQATLTADTPTVFDEQASVRTKTALESLQIRKTDVKGW
jgi:hypothetical protein